MDFRTKVWVNGDRTNERSQNERKESRSTQHNRNGQILRTPRSRGNRILGERAKALPHFSVRTLGKYRSVLTKQQIKTLRGQILAGDIIGAEKGLNKLLLNRIKCNG